MSLCTSSFTATIPCYKTTWIPHLIFIWSNNTCVHISLHLSDDTLTSCFMINNEWHLLCQWHHHPSKHSLWGNVSRDYTKYKPEHCPTQNSILSKQLQWRIEMFVCCISFASIPLISCVTAINCHRRYESSNSTNKNIGVGSNNSFFWVNTAAQ